MKYIIDVREPYEYASSHVEGALNIPVSTLMNSPKGLDEISKDSEIVVYCRSGNRSGMAKQILESMGYSNVTNGISQEQIETN